MNVLNDRDAFEIATALYMYANMWHGGQGTRAYAIFSDLENVAFRPSPMLRDDEDLSEEEGPIYQALVDGDLDIDAAVNRMCDLVHGSAE